MIVKTKKHPPLNRKKGNRRLKAAPFVRRAGAIMRPSAGEKRPLPGCGFSAKAAIFPLMERNIRSILPSRAIKSASPPPLKETQLEGKFGVEVKVSGGGIGAQAEAVRHGISRALLKINPELKKPLKRAGFLTRDPRMVERKKYGLKKARRAPQWAKR